MAPSSTTSVRYRRGPGEEADKAERTTSTQKWIDDPKVAAFLTDRVRSRHLDPFLGREATIGEAAAELGLSAPRMSYWVAKLLELGLLQLVGSRSESRHRVRVYRSAADSFVLSLDLLAANHVEILGQYFAPVWSRFLTSLAAAGARSDTGWLVRFARSGDQAGFEIVPGSGSLDDVRVFNSWAKLTLTHERATELRRDLRELAERYAELQDPTGVPHWVHLASVEDVGD